MDAYKNIKNVKGALLMTTISDAHVLLKGMKNSKRLQSQREPKVPGPLQHEGPK